jgi:hypothetical protein
VVGDVRALLDRMLGNLRLEGMGLLHGGIDGDDVEPHSIRRLEQAERQRAGVEEEGRGLQLRLRELPAD